MLQIFVAMNRNAIISRARETVGSRQWRCVSTVDIENGVLLILTQLEGMLISEGTSRTFSINGAVESPPQHVHESVASAFDASQLPHAYSDVCQAITEVAVQENAPVTLEEFHLLDRCLDHAVAEALEEYAGLRGPGSADRRGQSPPSTL